MARGGNSLLDRANLLPHEIGELHQEDLLGIENIDLVERGLGRKDVKRVDADPEVGRTGSLHDVPRGREFVDRAAPRQAFVRNLDAERQRQHR